MLSLERTLTQKMKGYARGRRPSIRVRRLQQLAIQP